MLTLVSAVVLGVMIAMEKSKKVSLSGVKSSAAMMLISSAAVGIAVFEFFRSLLTLFNSYFKLDDMFENLSILLGGSKLVSGINLAISSILMIPLAIAAIYILVIMVRRPLEREGLENDAVFAARCAERHAHMAIIAAGVTGVTFIAAILASIPFWSELISTIIILNPVTVLFLLIVTFGLAFIPLIAVAVLGNAPLIILFTVATTMLTALYAFSAVFGIAASVRAYRSQRVEKAEAVICGVLSLLPVWCLIPMTSLRKKLKNKK